MVAISVVLFLFQTSVDNLSSDPTSLYDTENSIISAMDSGDYEIEENAEEGIPELPAEVSTESNDAGFTDIFESIKSWFQSTKGGKFISGLYYAIPNLLKGLGMPKVFSFAFGGMWTLFAMFSFVVFLRGLL